MAKRVIAMLLAGMMMAGVTACGSSDRDNAKKAGSEATGTESTAKGQEEDTAVGTTVETGEGDSRELVVYFSATGNTETAAETLADMRGADIYEIVPEDPYTEADLDYNDDSSRSTQEQNDEDARPEIAGEIENIADYDVIYVGYPIWWGDMPRILYTFFDTYDLSGKTIAPFCTSGGSGLSGTPSTIESLEPDATVLEGLHTSASGAESDLADWLSSIGL